MPEKALQKQEIRFLGRQKFIKVFHMKIYLYYIMFYYYIIKENYFIEDKIIKKIITILNM